MPELPWGSPRRNACSGFLGVRGGGAQAPEGQVSKVGGSGGRGVSWRVDRAARAVSINMVNDNRARNTPENLHRFFSYLRVRKPFALSGTLV